MDYSGVSSSALLDMAFVASFKSDKSEYEEIMQELEGRTRKPIKQEEDYDDDCWF